MSFTLLDGGGTKPNPSNVTIQYHKPLTVPSVRDSPHKRGYGDKEILELFRLIIRRDRVCQICKYRLCVVVDHKLAKAKGGTNNPSNLWGLCKRCHDIKTYLCDGGLGRQKKDLTDEVIQEIYRKSLI